MSSTLLHSPFRVTHFYFSPHSAFLLSVWRHPCLRSDVHMCVVNVLACAHVFFTLISLCRNICGFVLFVCTLLDERRQQAQKKKCNVPTKTAEWRRKRVWLRKVQRKPKKKINAFLFFCVLCWCHLVCQRDIDVISNVRFSLVFIFSFPSNRTLLNSSFHFASSLNHVFCSLSCLDAFFFKGSSCLLSTTFLSVWAKWGRRCTLFVHFHPVSFTSFISFFFLPLPLHWFAFSCVCVCV